mmetsp:Transcript_11794/g.35966  ORF Transcript_11794/g.35966 Transcript_11794/m.35966 type:complete len:375 (-) Transcript_11794:135-1259(-)
MSEAAQGDKRGRHRGDGASDGRAKRARYFKKALTSRDKQFGTNQRGVLITCGQREESQCTKEAIVLFSEYAERLHPEFFAEDEPASGASDKAKELDKELATLRKKKDTSNAVFSSFNVGVHSTVFIRFEKEELDPVQTVTSILDDAKTSGQGKCRYCVRFIPVQNSCYAKIEDATEMCRKLAQQNLPPVEGDVAEEKSPKFAIVFRKRNNSTADRDKFIESIAKAMPQGYKVDLTKPDWVLAIEIMRTTCCAAFVQRYHELGKLNVKTIIEKYHQNSVEGAAEKVPDAAEKTAGPPPASKDQEKAEGLEDPSADKVATNPGPASKNDDGAVNREVTETADTSREEVHAQAAQPEPAQGAEKASAQGNEGTEKAS